jgi:hypothetical protein
MSGKVAGGDGTVGWVLGSLTELHTQDRKVFFYSLLHKDDLQ